MAYKWTDTETIQAYLDTVSANLKIDSSDELSAAAAVLHENDVVFEITTILSAAWEGLEKLGVSDVPDDLKRLAAKLTASRLGTARVAGTLGQLPEWIRSYRHEVFQQARFMVINFKTVEIQGATRRNVDISELLLTAKPREDVWQGEGNGR